MQIPSDMNWQRGVRRSCYSVTVTLLFSCCVRCVRSSGNTYLVGALTITEWSEAVHWLVCVCKGEHKLSLRLFCQEFDLRCFSFTTANSTWKPWSSDWLAKTTVTWSVQHRTSKADLDALSFFYSPPYSILFFLHFPKPCKPLFPQLLLLPNHFSIPLSPLFDLDAVSFFYSSPSHSRLFFLHFPKPSKPLFP